MAGYQEVKQTILLLRASTNVVQHLRAAAVGAASIRDQADMWQVAGQPPCHHIARVGGGWQGCADPGQQDLQVGHAAVIDVAVGGFQALLLRIGRDIRLHLAVDGQSQINIPRCAEGADDDIGAHTVGGVDIATGEIQALIAGVVDRGDPDLCAGGTYQLSGDHSGDLLGGGGQGEDEAEQADTHGKI